MRNNQDRIGVEPPTNNLQPAHEAPPTVEAMQFIVPTELVELPSKGLFYQEGHPLYQRDSIEIKHMTTKEEDILTNQGFIKNGTAVEKLLQSVLVSPKMNTRDMLVGDKNALTVACRVHGYGSDYSTRVSCPACGTPQDFTFDLNEIEYVNFEDNLAEFDAEINYERQTVILPIPRTKVKLELKILKEERNTQKTKKRDKNSFVISKQYEKMIYSVNGNSDRNYVRSYISSMSALDSRYLRAAYSQITPGVDFNCGFECDSCGHETNVEVPLTAEFFWPKS